MSNLFHFSIIGIDLGTTNSCVAVMESGNAPKVIENSEGKTKFNLNAITSYVPRLASIAFTSLPMTISNPGKIKLTSDSELRLKAMMYW